MTPYYADEYVTLYHGDCFEVEAWVDADVLVTDPPYGIDGNLSYDHKAKGSDTWTSVHPRRPEWDTNLDARNCALSLWGDRPAAVFGSARRLDDPPPYREVPLIWDKGGVGMGDVTFPWGSCYELIYVSGEGWTGKRETPVLRWPLPTHTARDVGHPTPKPVPLMIEIMAKAPPGVIADPFAGSGSTLVAAKKLGRKAIGVELDERYCEIAARRLAQGVLNFEEATR